MSNPQMLEYATPDESGRLAPGEGVGVIWRIALAATAIWILVASTYASVKFARAPRGTPTTQISYTPYETALLGIVVPLAVIGTLVAGNLVLRPGGLSRLGLDARALPRGILLGLALALVVVPLVYVVGVLAEFFWQLVGMQHPNAHPLLRIIDQNGDPLLRTMIIFSAVCLAPLYEELLFRGHFQTAILYTLDRNTSHPMTKYVAILNASIIFTLFHGELWMMPPIFFLSLCLGYLYERTRNLWVPIVIHACFNGTSIFYFLRELSHH